MQLSSGCLQTKEGLRTASPQTHAFASVRDAAVTATGERGGNGSAGDFVSWKLKDVNNQLFKTA